MSIAVMRQALEALENHTAIKHPQQRSYRDAAIDALRQAIEQAEQALEAAVKAEREACAALLDEMAAQDKLSNYYAVAARAIRARGEDPMPLFDDWDGGFQCKESK
jgi:hypothetical protein